MDDTREMSYTPNPNVMKNDTSANRANAKINRTFLRLFALYSSFKGLIISI